MKWARTLTCFLAAAVIGGCATYPPGPSVMVLPAPGKTFEMFQADELTCRGWAAQQSGLSPSETVNRNMVDGAAVGTLMGAGLGAAIGAASGNPATGMAIGAASGLVGGTAVASGPAYAAGGEAQRRYDMAYQQCMYAKGNQIPGLGIDRTSQRSAWIPPPPPPKAWKRP
jgi:hypothetical protein